MSDKSRFRKGIFNTIAIPADEDTNIEVGDFCFVDIADNLRNGASSTATHHVFPYSSFDTNSLTTELAAASDYFIGIALEAHDAGTEENILIGTDGDWNVDLYTSSTCAIGDVIEPYSASTPNTSDQTCQVVALASKANPIGYVLTDGTSQTTCIMRMRSLLGLGGLIS
jgi:hypothetical protein